jgi:predicted house-cleaning noncanonical NTP pyrophosphatase (MazG superfamily)
MSEPVLPKLVRDKIPELFPQHTYSSAGPQEFSRLLIAKLREETEEVVQELESGTWQGVIEEAADLQEILLAVLAYCGVGPETLEQARQLKWSRRGGFTQYRVLEKMREEQQ